MNVKRIRQLLQVFMLLAIWACTEPFDPVIDVHDRVLVVEGVVTDQEGPQRVRLSYGVPFGETLFNQQVTGAIVYVEDQSGSKTYFPEAEPGVYLSSNHFRAREGGSYTLHVETVEGDVYRSDPQWLNPQPYVEKIDVLVDRRMMEFQNIRGEQEFGEVEGLAFSTLMETTGQQVPMMRFQSTILVQYVLYELDPEIPGDPNYNYCIRKVGVDDNVNLTVAEIDVSVGDAITHEVGFMPTVLRFYEGDPTNTWGFLRTERRVWILQQYALNEESYAYYKGLRELLSSEGRMFDPIPGQLHGNIRCVNDPSKLALGFFEVSAMQATTFAITPRPYLDGLVRIYKTHDMHQLPEQECYYEQLPPYWLHRDN